jgi:hypothetical protein
VAAGYSGTPLAKKLGIAEGDRVALLGAPDGFESTLEGMPAGVDVRTSLRGTCDVIVSFHTERTHFASRLPKLMAALAVDGGLWIAWPKKASKVPTDITEDTVREVGLPTGMVDNKVCAIDEVWSGLRLVLRKELRSGRTTAAG